MRIIFDNIIFSLQKAGGISIYWTELIRELSSKNEMIFYESINENIFRERLDILSKKEIFLPYKILRYLPFIKKLKPKSIFHSSYYRTTLQNDIVKITTVYDFTYEYHKSGIAKIIHSWQKNKAINNADGVICISKNTKNDLLKFYPHIDKNKVKIIHISASEEFCKLNDLSNIVKKSRFKQLANKKIILYVGDRKSDYKNFHLAVEVVSSLNDCILVSVGSGAITDKEKLLLDKMLKNRFYHFTAINSAELNILYNISFCLLYPSTYEGFGIPLLEAMRAGCPVISTNLSSIPEVVGNGGILVNDIKKEKFIESIKLLENSILRRKIINEGYNQAKKFSWKKCADETINFYKYIKELKYKK